MFLSSPSLDLVELCSKLFQSLVPQNISNDRPETAEKQQRWKISAPGFAATDKMFMWSLLKLLGFTVPHSK